MSAAERDADRIEQAEVHAIAVQEENDRLHKLVDDLRQGDGHEVCRTALSEVEADRQSLQQRLDEATQRAERAEQTHREDSADWATTVRTMQCEINARRALTAEGGERNG
jgi:hypothetical protein